MSTRSYTSLRRFKTALSAVVLTGVSLCGFTALAQGTTGVVSSSLAAWSHTGSLGQLWDSVVSTRGDFVAIDFQNNALYGFPANAGPVQTLRKNGALGGGYADLGLGIDPRNNNLYTNNNYSGGLISIPYDAATGTWDLPTAVVASALTGAVGTCGSYFQSTGLAINDQGLMVIGTQGGCGQGIITVTLDSSGNFGPAVNVVTALKSRSRNVAIDHAGNIYFNEDGGNKGVFFIPAGTTNLADETKLTRVDPQLSNIQGVSVDTAGNVYIADSSAGVYYVPLQNGVPNPAAAVLLTTASAQGNASIDASRGVLDVPINAWNGFQDAVKVYLNRIELGSVAVGTKTPGIGTVYYTFTGGATPHSFVIQQGGSAANFALGTGGTCVADTAVKAGASCTVALNFTPQLAGDISGQLLMLDASGNVLATTALHGIGQASEARVTPSAEATVATPVAGASQVATDNAGNVYVAAAGSAQVLEYAAGSTSAKPVSIGTGLTAPTGVAVDGSGNVYIADSGKVLEIPNGPTGLNAAGQVTIQSGFGSKLQLAADSVGDVFVNDPDNKRVVRLGGLTTTSLTGVVARNNTTFAQATAIAADKSGDYFVANGSNLVEVSVFGGQSTLLTSLSGVTSMAVDASGSVYVLTSTGIFRIPNEGGTLNPSDQIAIASDVASPVSVALDPAGNAYISDAAGDVKFVSTSAFGNFGTLTSTNGSAAQTFTILNTGNAPLAVTGFAGTADYTGAGSSCVGPIAVNATCSATVTFSPGPGDQGTLTGTVLLTGNEANVPVGIMGTGVGAALAASKTTISVSAATVDGAPAVITVAPSSSTGATPTGQVTLTVSGGGLTTPVTATGSLSGGKVTITPPQVAAGTYTFTANYIGDRVYGTSSATTSATIAAGPVNLIQPTMAQVQQALPTYPYILSAGSGADEPYDGSVTQYEYNYQVKVVATDGVALIGQPILDKTGKQVATNYGSISFGGVPAGSGCVPVPVAADGTATFASDCLTINTTNSAVPNILTSYTVTPMYSPAGTGASAGYTNPNYTAITGTPISFTALRNPMVQISSNPGTLNITAGSSGKATLTLTSLLGYGIAGSGALLNNYSLPLQLACDGLPAYATCTFTYSKPDPSDPNSVNVGPAAGTVLSYRGGTAAACTSAQGCVGPGSVVVTINTNISPYGTANLRQNKSETVFASLFGLGLCGLVLRRRRSTLGRLLVLGGLLLGGTMTAGISGCSTTQLGTTTGNPTPAGTYAVSVTAKQVGSQVITQTPGIVYGNENQMSLPFTMNVTIQ